MTREAVHLAGYAVQELDDDEYIALNFVLNDEKGEVQFESPIFCRFTNQPENHIQRERVALLARSLCRFYNYRDKQVSTDENDSQQINNMLTVFKYVPKTTMDPSWRLASTSVGEHVFVNTTEQKILRVVENEFTEVVSTNDIPEILAPSVHAMLYG